MSQNPDNQSQVSKHLEDVYKKELIKEIANHWKNLSCENVEVEDLYERLREERPWFGDFEGWYLKVAEVYDPQDICKLKTLEKSPLARLWKRFPVSFRDPSFELAREMDYLFPETELTKAFLPILITSYCVSRVSSRQSNMDFLPNLIQKIFYEKHTKCPFSDTTILKILKLPSLHRKYPKYTASNYSLRNPASALSMIGTVYLFFLFLTETAEICNVSWSFYVFECMTSYLDKLDAEAIKFIDILDEIHPSCVLKTDPLKKKSMNMQSLL